MREARERVDYERKLANKKRVSQGLAALPTETYQIDIKSMTKKLFDEIEEKKVHFQRMAVSAHKRMQEEKDRMDKIEQTKKEEQKEWEHTRDKRVKSWRRFRDSRLNGKKKGKYETRPLEVRAEIRPETIKKSGPIRPLGAVDDFKKAWN